MRKLSYWLILLVGLGMAMLSMAAPEKPVTVAILAPVQVQAMNEIIAGLKEELNAKYLGKVTFIVKNAEGDAGLMRAELQQFNDNSSIDVVAPIGTPTSQMAMTLITNKPIVAIAADYTKAQVAKAKNSNFTTLHDDPSPTKQLAFLKVVLPQLKKITLVHSDTQRILTEVATATAVAKRENITIQSLMIHQLSDLYSVSNQIDSNSQAIYILQDETVVSGVKALIKQAQDRHIPVIASDDGSVKAGTAFALGFKQRDIGVQGADLIIKVLQGTPARNIPIKYMTTYNVFINSPAADRQGVSSKDLLAAADKLNYPVVMVK